MASCEFGESCPLEGLVEPNHRHYGEGGVGYSGMGPSGAFVRFSLLFDEPDDSTLLEAYRLAALRWHPDLGPPGELPARTARMAAINEARERGDLSELRRLGREQE